MNSAYVAGDDLAVMYDRHVGRYARSLAEHTCERLEIAPGTTAAAVGCATGHLAAALAERLGDPAVVAIEAQGDLAEAARARNPGIAVVTGELTAMPWDNGSVDVAICQGELETEESIEGLITEMRRITRRGGTVAATVWDYETMTLLHAFWTAAIQIDPIRAVVAGQGAVTAQMTAASLEAMWLDAKLTDVSVEELVVNAAYMDVDELWAPFEAPITQSGSYIRSLDPELRERIRVEFVRRLGNPVRPFSLRAGAFLVRGTV